MGGNSFDGVDSDKLKYNCCLLEKENGKDIEFCIVVRVSSNIRLFCAETILNMRQTREDNSNYNY